MPGFLFFDQPSQAHYPPDVDEVSDPDQLEDSDRAAVHGLFELIEKASREISEPWQVIILDHVHIKDQWFEDAVVEEWRHGAKLIPMEWPDG